MSGALADVAGVEVTHLTLDEGEVQTGVTVIRPYPRSAGGRKLFLGARAGEDWNEWTGQHVARDFGTFSSPIVLCNVTSIGSSYDALISHGFQRDTDLPTDQAWPPIVVGLDDGFLNDLRARRVTHERVLALLAGDGGSAGGADGSVGIGRGLCAFGAKGGVGQASSAATIDGERQVVAALVAAGGGRAPEGAAASVAPGFVLVLATDLPMLPADLRALAEAGLRALERTGAIGGGDARLALAFSTTNAIVGAFEAGFRLSEQRVPGARQLALARELALESTLAALRSALEEARPVSGRRGRRVEPLAPERVAALFGAGAPR